MNGLVKLTALAAVFLGLAHCGSSSSGSSGGDGGGSSDSATNHDGSNSGGDAQMGGDSSGGGDSGGGGDAAQDSSGSDGGCLPSGAQCDPSAMDCCSGQCIPGVQPADGAPPPPPMCL